MASETQTGGLADEIIDAVAQRGRVYDLGHRLFSGMPVSPMHPPYTLTLSRRYGDIPRDDGVTTANEMLVMCAHTGTHIDALGHASRNGKVHGGLDAAAVVHGGRGLTALGIETCPPIVCRGVLLDVAALKRVDCLPPATAITPDNLQAAAEAEGVEIQPGDAVLVRSGWTKRFNDREQYLGGETGAPGPDAAAIRWLIARGIRVTGGDTIAYELRVPGRNEAPGHGLLLVDAGVPIIEVMDLEALSRDRIYRFLFVVSPLKLVGATGSPVRPIAIA